MLQMHLCRWNFGLYYLGSSPPWFCGFVYAEGFELGFDFAVIEVVVFLCCCITHWFLLFLSSLPAMTNEEFCCSLLRSGHSSCFKGIFSGLFFLSHSLMLQSRCFQWEAGKLCLLFPPAPRPGGGDLGISGVEGMIQKFKAEMVLQGQVGCAWNSLGWWDRSQPMG